MMDAYLLHHLLEGTVIDPVRTAIISGEKADTYADLQHRTLQLAIILKQAGIVCGDRVAILLPKSFDECAAIFAISRANAVFVPINPAFRPGQVRHIIEDCSARALISATDLLTKLGDALSGLDCLRVTLNTDEIGADVVDECGKLAESSAIGEDLAAILYTSGSTGRPKGVMLSHRNLLAGTRIVRNYLGIGPIDRVLSILPFSFDYGLNQLLCVVEQRACIVLLTFKLGDEIVKALAHYQITGLAGVPTVWAILTRAAPSLTLTTLPHLRYITNSGGAVPSDTVKRLCELLPTTQIFLMYGLTEAFRSTFLPPEDVSCRPTSIGKAISECEVYPMTADGRRARPGEPGILVHRGPTVSLGYWNRPDDTALVIRQDPERPAALGGGKICWSGDLVVEDKDGFLYFVGREDAMIKSAGYRISPTEVEEVLMAHGGFRQVAVIGLPDEWIGQRIHAIAVPVDETTDVENVLQKAAKALPAHMVPSQIELVDKLPTTPNGKIDYKRLIAERTS
jgi:acyl-CoA ligase (AMP-forming) (exosortase A-associated)